MAQTVTVVYFGYSNVYYQLYSAQVEWSGFQNKNEMNNILQLYYYIFFLKSQKYTLSKLKRYYEILFYKNVYFMFEEFISFVLTLHLFKGFVLFVQ